MSNAFFVTATGTEIGKTYVSAALLSAARQKGHRVHALKPLMSGFAPEALEQSDAGQLLRACGRTPTPETVTEICLHAFPDPLAPNVAARNDGTVLDDQRLIEFCQRGLMVAAPDSLTLIEGAGGILSPISDTMLHAELISALNLPVILVTSNYLGAVTHTLTALEALAQRNIKIALCVVSQPTAASEPPEPLTQELALWQPKLRVINAPFSPDPTETGTAIRAALNL